MQLLLVSMNSEDGFRNLVSKFASSVESVNSVINTCLVDVDYDDISVEDKIRYDLFLAYAMNSLLWVYMRSKGQDPMQTVLRTELNRIKEFMTELQRIIDRKTMPRLDQGAAKRFVRHGLWDAKNREEKPKHIRFSD